MQHKLVSLSTNLDEAGVESVEKSSWIFFFTLLICCLYYSSFMSECPSLFLSHTSIRSKKKLWIATPSTLHFEILLSFGHYDILSTHSEQCILLPLLPQQSKKKKHMPAFPLL